MWRWMWEINQVHMVLYCHGMVEMASKCSIGRIVCRAFAIAEMDSGGNLRLGCAFISSV